MAVVESVKAASDIYAPVAGTVVAANAAVVAAPETVNADAYACWFYRLKPANAGRRRQTARCGCVHRERRRRLSFPDSDVSIAR